jgi:hypothetical protein
MLLSAELEREKHHLFYFDYIFARLLVPGYASY